MSANGIHKLHPNYVPVPPGSWESWFAWHPVKQRIWPARYVRGQSYPIDEWEKLAKESTFRRCWLKQIYRRRTNDFGFYTEWEYAFNDFDLIKGIDKY